MPQAELSVGGGLRSDRTGTFASRSKRSPRIGYRCFIPDVTLSNPEDHLAATQAMVESGQSRSLDVTVTEALAQWQRGLAALRADIAVAEADVAAARLPPMTKAPSSPGPGRCWHNASPRPDRHCAG